MSLKTKTILTLVAAVAAMITWFMFKKTIIATLYTVGVGLLVIAGLYVGGRVWWWSRKR